MGAVGSIAGQIAKLKGCRVVGIAGGADKCKFLIDELGFDGAIDYESEDVVAGLKRECPKGVDVYFDNVDGDILDAVLSRLNLARVVICRAIGQFNNKEAVKGPANYLSLLATRRTSRRVRVEQKSRTGIELLCWVLLARGNSTEWPNCSQTNRKSRSRCS